MVNKIGSAGFISQSGGHAGKMAAISLTRQIGFSKVASIGNCCDLGSADFLEYMAWDPKTGVVGMYLEGPRDSARLFEVMREATRRKPVFVWKGGRTAAGARAASSHTGALAASASVWSAALRQAGAVEVNGLDELADTLLLFQSVGRLERANLGIVCGLTDGGGGEAVLSADACAAQGIEVTPFTDRTRRELLGLLGQVGSVLVNPVDVSQRSGNLQAFEKTIELVAAEPGIDLIAVYENVDLLMAFMSRPMADSDERHSGQGRAEVRQTGHRGLAAGHLRQGPAGGRIQVVRSGNSGLPQHGSGSQGHRQREAVLSPVISD